MIKHIWLALGFCIFPFFSFAHGENSRSVIEIITTDFQFIPNVWSVNRGEAASLLLSNHGKQEHEWVLLKLGTKVTLPFDADDEAKVFWEIEAGPTIEKKEIFITPLKAGTYDIVCGKPRHIERGMKGTLIVK